jgi:hypothetical protein
MYENLKQLLTAVAETAEAVRSTGATHSRTAVPTEGAGDAYHHVHRQAAELAASGAYHCRDLGSLHEVRVTRHTDGPRPVA